jgi:hypothetical protein
MWSSRDKHSSLLQKDGKFKTKITAIGRGAQKDLKK